MINAFNVHVGTKMYSVCSTLLQSYLKVVDGTARIMQKVESDRAKLVIKLFVGKMKFDGLAI
jgi:ribosomal protein L7Ae-like RNA K-turn-binding protein